jgi:hypothetical protein
MDLRGVRQNENTKFLLENLKGRDNLGDLIIGSNNVLTWILKKYVSRCALG